MLASVRVRTGVEGRPLRAVERFVRGHPPWDRLRTTDLARHAGGVARFSFTQPRPR